MMYSAVQVGFVLPSIYSYVRPMFSRPLSLPYLAQTRSHIADTTVPASSLSSLVVDPRRIVHTSWFELIVKKNVPP